MEPYDKSSINVSSYLKDFEVYVTDFEYIYNYINQNGYL